MGIAPAGEHVFASAVITRELSCAALRGKATTRLSTAKMAEKRQGVAFPNRV
jgi:hypothetical protein